jgi:hypothetical protein
MTPLRGGEEEEGGEVEAAVEFPIEAAAAASPTTEALGVARVAPNSDPVALGAEAVESCIVEEVAASPTSQPFALGAQVSFLPTALAVLVAPSVLSVPSSLTVGRFVIAPRRSAKNAEILSKRSLKNVATLPVRFTMSVGTAPGVTPSGELPFWEPAYTIILLIAVR